MPLHFPDIVAAFAEHGQVHLRARELAAMGLFRLLRIAGVFARLDRIQGGRRYMAYMPYVKRELAACLNYLDARIARAVRLEAWP